MLSVMKKRKFEPLKDSDKEDDEPTTIVVDSTRISTTKKGSYIEEMWRREKRKFETTIKYCVRPHLAHI